jgi:hypothetical protein
MGCEGKEIKVHIGVERESDLRLVTRDEMKEIAQAEDFGYGKSHNSGAFVMFERFFSEPISEYSPPLFSEEEYSTISSDLDKYIHFDFFTNKRVHKVYDETNTSYTGKFTLYECKDSSKKIDFTYFRRQDTPIDSFYHYTASFSVPIYMGLMSINDNVFLAKENNKDLCFSEEFKEPQECYFGDCKDYKHISSDITKITSNELDSIMAHLFIDEDKSVNNINTELLNQNNLGFIGSGTTLKSHEIVNNFSIYENEITDRENDAFMEYNFLEEGNLTRYYHSENSDRVEIFSDVGFTYGVSADGEQLLVKNADIYATTPLETISTYTFGKKLDNGCFSATHHYSQQQSNQNLEVNTIQKSLCGQDSSLVFSWCLEKATICPN